MNKKLLIDLVCLIALLCNGFGAQANEALSCPPYISVSQKMATPLPGWDIRRYNNDAELMRLSAVTFYAGPPSEKAELTPSDDNTVENKSISKWKLHRKPNDGQKFWMECFYSSTNMALSKRLPGSVKECSVFYDRNIHGKSEFFVERVECK